MGTGRPDVRANGRGPLRSQPRRAGVSQWIQRSRRGSSADPGLRQSTDEPMNPSPSIGSYRPGLSGRVAALFIGSKLTPLIMISALLLGLFAVLLTPREEEPQIVVPM